MFKKVLATNKSFNIQKFIFFSLTFIRRISLLSAKLSVLITHTLFYIFSVLLTSYHYQCQFLHLMPSIYLFYQLYIFTFKLLSSCLIFSFSCFISTNSLQLSLFSVFLSLLYFFHAFLFLLHLIADFFVSYLLLRYSLNSSLSFVFCIGHFVFQAWLIDESSCVRQ